MKDFMENMNFCGYDLEKADQMAKQYIDAIEEALSDCGLETLEPKPDSREPRRGLRHAGHIGGDGQRLV